jgi:hypothetical protein
MRNISKRDCNRNFKTLGEHYANCVINDKSNLLNIGSEDEIKQVILHKKRMDDEYYNVGLNNISELLLELNKRWIY